MDAMIIKSIKAIHMLSFESDMPSNDTKFKGIFDLTDVNILFLNEIPSLIPVRKLNVEDWIEYVI